LIFELEIDVAANQVTQWLTAEQWRAPNERPNTFIRREHFGGGKKHALSIVATPSEDTVTFLHATRQLDVTLAGSYI